MMINFIQIFQESGNFMRNRQKFSLLFILLFFSNAIFFGLLSADTPPLPAQEGAENLQSLAGNTSLYQALISVFLSSWATLIVHQSSLRHIQPLAQSFSSTLKRFGGILVLNGIAMFLLAMSVAEGLLAIMTNTTPSPFSLITLVLGAFIFTRLCLADTHYLTQSAPLLTSLTFIWQMGKKNTLSLFIFCAITYLLIPMVTYYISLLSNQMIFKVFFLLLTSTINVFVLIFNYRFYTLLTQKAA